MATIIDFRMKSARRPDLAKVPLPSAPAIVVLFPGVRYERWDSETEEPQVRAPSSRLDRSELAD